MLLISSIYIDFKYQEQLSDYNIIIVYFQIQKVF
jgi:hypothetical protein